MWITISKVFKIIKAVSSKKNNFTINLKDYYSRINVNKDKIKIYCIPKLLRTHDIDTGYEINIKTSKNNDYIYNINTTSKGIKDAPKTIKNEAYFYNDTKINFKRTLEIEPYCKYIKISYIGMLFTNHNNLKIYLDGNLIYTFTPVPTGSSINFTLKEYTINIKDIYNPHTLIVESLNYDDFRFSNEYYCYNVIAQYYGDYIDDDNEINCFFVIEE